MAWSISDINKKVVYTPEITVVKKGKPADGTMVAVGHGYLRVRLADGTEKQVETRLCERV